MEEKRNKHTFLLVFAISILFISIIGFIISLNMNAFAIIQEQGVPITIKISNYTALNISRNQQELNLGTVASGTSGQRNLSIDNGYNFKTSFEFEVKGDIAPLMDYYPRAIVLEPLETREVMFRTKIIEDEDIGTYSGMIYVKVKRIPE